MGTSLINPRNQQGLRYLFDIQDPQSNPETVDMTAVQPTVDMSFGGFARLGDYSKQISCTKMDVSLNGLQTKTVRILSYNNISGSDVQAVYPLGHVCVCWGMKFHLYFNQAGATALNGKYVSLELKMKTPDNTEIVKYCSAWHMSSGCLLYSPGHYEMPPFTRQNLCVIPPGCAIELTTWTQDGTVNFPASTELRYTFYGTAYPVGSPLPIGI